MYKFVNIERKNNDEVIFCKSPTGKTFNEIYENMNRETSKYEGEQDFKSVDRFKAPTLELNEKREYEELANKEFTTEKGGGVIEKAIQTIEISLDEK